MTATTLRTVTALTIALGASIVALKQELLIIVVAAFIAIGLEPAVSWLTRRHLPRWAAVLLISLLSVGLAAAFLAAAIPPLVNEASQLVKHGPQYLQQLSLGDEPRRSMTTCVLDPCLIRTPAPSAVARRGTASLECCPWPYGTRR